MCGIVGFTGRRQAAAILLDGLGKLEYRGYDSAGIAVRDGEKLAEVIKSEGKLNNLREKTDNGKAIEGTCGIGHTRWATHGVSDRRNAHPHVSGNCTGSGCGPVESNVVGVHNGIIENYREIREKLARHGYEFYSDTDTEAAIKLIDYYYRKYRLGPVDAIARSMVRIRGSYAIEVMFKDCPGEIYVMRKDSPMIVGIAGGETFVASDVPAILEHTRTVYYVGNMEMARLLPGEAHFYDLNGDEIGKEPTEITFTAEAAEKGGFEHFMLKEIHEQPGVIADTLHSAVNDGVIDIGVDNDTLAGIRQVLIVACGSAYHAGIAGQYVIEQLANVPVRVELASEYRYRSVPAADGTLAVIISQSGETADSLSALRKAKAAGILTLAVVNVVGSSIAREADCVFYTKAGPEIAVATTKAYSAQLVSMYLLALALAGSHGAVSPEECSELLEELETLPEKVEKLLSEKERVQWFASKLVNTRDVFYMGRGIDYAACLEGSLKMKEISYIHSEAYAAGELKHGTISLIENGRLVIGVLTQPELYEKTLSNLYEVKTRGAYLMAVTSYGNYSIEDNVDFVIYVPRISRYFYTSLVMIPLQLLAYYTAVGRGEDVDKPRNLAKSVTVE